MRNAQLEFQHLDQLLLGNIALRNEQVAQLPLGFSLLDQRFLKLLLRDNPVLYQQVSKSLLHDRQRQIISMPCGINGLSAINRSKCSNFITNVELHFQDGNTDVSLCMRKSPIPYYKT
ncbi:hypothetical protein D3C73_1423920 [compost metagenome]